MTPEKYLLIKQDTTHTTLTIEEPLGNTTLTTPITTIHHNKHINPETAYTITETITYNIHHQNPEIPIKRETLINQEKHKNNKKQP